MVYLKKKGMKIIDTDMFRRPRKNIIIFNLTHIILIIIFQQIMQMSGLKCRNSHNEVLSESELPH